MDEEEWKQPEEWGTVWTNKERGGLKDSEVVLVESLGIDSGSFDMLICLLTALIAPSSHRTLQREDAFSKR